MSELTALLTHDGLALLDEVGAIESSADVARSVSRLRAAGHSPDLVSAVVGQAHLRVRAKAKFGEFAERMLFTRAGLEQATRLNVATMHAVRMRQAGITQVTDLGCGIGGDSLAFAGAGIDVTAVDADEVTSAIAAYNLAPFGATVHHGLAENHVPADGAVWLDPARRTAGHSETKRTSASDWSPSLDWCFEVARMHPTGIKLGPGLDRDLIPDDVEAQWVSARGSVVELALFSGVLTRDGIRRSALVMQGDETHELTAAADAEDEPIRELGEYLHEPDGAVIRARLIGEVARMLKAGMVDEQIAYLTGDAALTSPFVQSFRVREQMPVNVKTINTALRWNDIGTLEIKKRGMDIDPAKFRRKLHLKGTKSATLILTRTAAGRVAILADRV